jgi:hypothetical protein
MKLIRDGMEDYELLAMAKQLGLGDAAKQISRSLYPVTYQATTTPQKLESARAQLAQMILHALGKDGGPDGGSPDAGPASDGGVVVVVDAGQDAGTVAGGDAGSDAGAIASNDDAGTPDAAVVVTTPDPVSSASFGPTTGCAGAGAPALWAAPIVLAWLVRRRARGKR